MSENTIRVVRQGAKEYVDIPVNQNYHTQKDRKVFRKSDTVLLELDEWSVNPCEKCVAECKGKVGHVTDGTYCISRANYETEQAIINKLKEATK